MGSTAPPIRVPVGQRLSLRYDSHGARGGGEFYPRYSLAGIQGNALAQVGATSPPSKPEGRHGTRYRTATFEAKRSGTSTIRVTFSNAGADKTFTVRVMTPEGFAKTANRPRTKRFTGFYCGVRKADKMIIKDQKTWERVWNQVFATCDPKPPAPTIDFTKQAALAVFMGEFATGGYSIQMRTVRDTGTRIEVVVVQRRPGPGDLTTDAFSQPYDILVIPKPNKPIAFVR